MADKLEGRPREILDEAHYAVLSTPRDDGTIQSVVIWVHTEDGNVTINSAEGRSWPANLRRSGTATITSMAHPYEWVSVTGRLEEDTHDGADQHIDELAKKYLGVDRYPGHGRGETRVRFVLRPERVHYVNQRRPASSDE